MPKVRAEVAVFIDNHYRTAGDVFEYGGPEDPNLVVLDGESTKHGRKMKKDARNEDAATE